MEIHWNTEWINGFIEAVLEHADWGIGPFKSDLAGYGSYYKPVLNEAGDYKVCIAFCIIGDKRADLCSYVYVRKDATINELQKKIEQLADEICNTVTSFKKGWT